MERASFKHQVFRISFANHFDAITLLLSLFLGKSASNLTLDSIDDFARYSDDGGRDVDEKVAGMYILLIVCFFYFILSYDFLILLCNIFINRICVCQC